MRRRPISAALLLSSLAVLAACSGPRIVENTPAAITVRYDPVVDNFDDAVAAAEKACASYGKTARQRKTDASKTMINRYAHFECVGK